MVSLEMCKAPRVTIAVPTFNRPDMLERCLSKLLTQIGSETEIIVADDASQIETALVLAQFNHPRLRKFRHDINLGLFQNFNFCLAQAVGEYIIILSDDDAIDDDLISSCLKLLDRADASPKCSALINANRYLVIETDGRQHSACPDSSLATGFYDGDVVLEHLWLGKVSFQLCGVLFETASLRRVGGFPIGHKYAGDLYAYASCFINHRVGYLASAKNTYVVHPRSETTALGMRYRMSDLGSVLKYVISIGKQRLPPPRGKALASSARWYISTEYLRNAMGIYRSGTSRRHCIVAMCPSIPWLIGRGGRAYWLITNFIFETSMPLKLKELCWTVKRISYQLIRRTTI